MDSCRFPEEICDLIMEALPYIPDSLDGSWIYELKGQHALCACALTCRAWRPRAQRLLLTAPRLLNERCLALFTAAIRTTPTLPITTLMLGRGRLSGSEVVLLNAASELLMQPLPHLQQLHCGRIHFHRGPPLQLLRMRLPFFAGITVLELWLCRFNSARAMLDVVWACPNVSSLSIVGASFETKRGSPAGHIKLSAICEHLRACRKLTYLDIDWETLAKIRKIADTGLPGSVFGHTVTELQFEIHSDERILSSFLQDSYPALGSIKIWSDMDSMTTVETQGKTPWLHAIATSRAVSITLKTLVIENYHKPKDNTCCRMVVGKGEKVVGSQKRLPQLLSGLEELTIRLYKCKDPRKCASYIHSVLPNMRNVLKIEYTLPCHADQWIRYRPVTR